jgi:hypothetical protein
MYRIECKRGKKEMEQIYESIVSFWNLQKQVYPWLLLRQAFIIIRTVESFNIDLGVPVVALNLDTETICTTKNG